MCGVNNCRTCKLLVEQYRKLIKGTPVFSHCLLKQRTQMLLRRKKQAPKDPSCLAAWQHPCIEHEGTTEKQTGLLDAAVIDHFLNSSLLPCFSKRRLAGAQNLTSRRFTGKVYVACKTHFKRENFHQHLFYLSQT